MVGKKDDRRVQRTRQLLHGALVSLIQEKGFEALTVQDIIDRANVGRATFYAHFDNKEDLLVSGLDEFRARIQAHQRRARLEAKGSDERAFLFSREVFAHANEYRDVFRAMVGKHSGAVVQRLLQKILVELVRNDVRAMIPQSADGTMPTEALIQYVAGGFFGLLSWWVDGKMRLSVDEVNGLFRQVAVPAVKAAMR